MDHRISVLSRYVPEYKHVGYGWNKTQLIGLINKLVKRISEDKYLYPREVLSLKLFTGMNEHMGNPLPGFDYECYGDNPKKNKETKAYYYACYQALINEKK